mgnify:CR=1 FL=1
MSKRAIVILYEGSEPSDGAKTAISRFLCDYGVVKLTGNIQQNIEIYCITEKEIIAAIAAKPISGDSNFFTVETVEEAMTPEAEAMIEISKRYGEKIAEGDMYGLFYKMLLDAKPKTDHNLTKAIYVLSREHSEDHIVAKTKKDAMKDQKILMQMIHL